MHSPQNLLFSFLYILKLKPCKDVKVIFLMYLLVEMIHVRHENYV